MKRTILSAFIVIAFSSSVAATDWPRWRGPNANGISAEKGWNAQALKNVRILWDIDIGRGHSSVSVKDNYLYTMGGKMVITGKDTTFTDIVYCLDANTGKEIWRYSYPTQWQNFPGPASTPTVDGDKVYTFSRDGDLFCFHARNGRVVWGKNIVSEGLAPIPDWGFCASPVVEGDLLLINAGKSGLALDKQTGRIEWRSENTPGNLATPVVFDHQNHRVAAILGNNTLYLIDVKTGSEIWSYRWETSNTDPIPFGNKLFLTGYDGGAAVLENGTEQPKVIWQKKRIRCRTWQNYIVIDGYAYGFGLVRRKQPLQCIDLATGEVKWRQEMDDWGSLMAAGDKLIILDGDGDLRIAKASPESYQEISSAKVLRMEHWQSYPQNELKCCWTTPVLVNGKIYARDTWGGLVCVDVSR